MAKKTTKKRTKTARASGVTRSAVQVPNSNLTKARSRNENQKAESPPGKGAKLRAKMKDVPGQFEHAVRVSFTTTLHRPKTTNANENWSFLNLPEEVSATLPSRGQVVVEGTFEGTPFWATLEPDGKGGHWLKVERELRESANAEVGDVVCLEIAPAAEEPEPTVPPDLKEALASAASKVREAWADITPAARRDFIHWIVSPKKAETRMKRIETACDMLAKGKRRPCCFDRSGKYSNSLSCPVADDSL